MATTTITQIPPADRTFYNKNLLKRAVPRLAYERFGQKYPVKLYSGDQPKWKRYNSLTDPLAPLAEGVTPTSQAWSETTYTGQLVQYGTYVEVSDYATWVSNDGKKLLTELSDTLGESLGSTKDKIVRDAVVGGTSVMYAGTYTSATAMAAKLAAADFDKIIRALDGANARKWNESPIIGTDKVGTTPIAAAYFAIVHPDTTYDLRAVLTTSFIEVHKYPDGGKSALPGEVGSYRNIRFIESTNAKVIADYGGRASVASTKYTTSSTKADVYYTMVFGQDAFGITPLTEGSMEMITHDFGEGNDPLNQRRTAGYKFCTDTVILNEEWMYRYVHCVSE